MTPNRQSDACQDNNECNQNTKTEARLMLSIQILAVATKIISHEFSSLSIQLCEYSA